MTTWLKLKTGPIYDIKEAEKIARHLKSIYPKCECKTDFADGNIAVFITSKNDPTATRDLRCKEDRD